MLLMVVPVHTPSFIASVAAAAGEGWVHSDVLCKHHYCRIWKWKAAKIARECHRLQVSQESSQWTMGYCSAFRISPTTCRWLGFE